MSVNMNTDYNVLTQTSAVYSDTAASQTDETTEKKQAENAASQSNTENEKAAVYESSKDEAAAKTSYKPDRKTVNQMLKESNSQVDAFRTMVEKLFNKQGLSFEQSIGMIRQYKIGTSEQDPSVQIDDATIRKAQEDVSEDGYYGVKQTSQRILDFAKALSGGDPSKIDTLRSAVEKGFKAAANTWGGDLPEISQKTYDAVMKGFDEWAEQSKTQDGTNL